MPPNLITLVQIFDKITVEKCSYCFLCYRTDSECALKTPLPHFKTITSLCKSTNINDEPTKICDMCEHLAIAAFKFREASFIATSIDMLFKGMLMSGHYHSEVRRLLNMKGRIQPTMRLWNMVSLVPIGSIKWGVKLFSFLSYPDIMTMQHLMNEYQRFKTIFLNQHELREYRKSMQMKRTDVVIIDTNNMFTSGPNSVLTHTNTMDSLDTTVISDDSDGAMDVQVDGHRKTDVSIKSNNTMEMNTVPPSDDVIILDDDPPSPQDKNIDKTPSRNFKKQTVNTTRPHSNNAPTQKKNVAKKKITMARTKPVQVDCRKEDTNSGQATLVPIEKLIQHSKTVAMPDLTTIGYLHPIYTSSDGSRNVPSLSARIVDGKLMIFEGLQTAAPAGASTVSVPSGDDNVTDQDGETASEDPANEDIAQVVDKILVDKLAGMKKIKKAGTVMGDSNVAKLPFMSNHRIDWEDKIPMDVISFMDATDPNPPSYIQPLIGGGVITDVRSLQNDTDQSTNRVIEEIIDLV